MSSLCLRLSSHGTYPIGNENKHNQALMVTETDHDLPRVNETHEVTVPKVGHSFDFAGNEKVYYIKI